MRGRGRILRRLAVTLALCLIAPILAAKPLRIALWNIEFERQGPGLLLRDILSGKDKQIEAALEVLAFLRADVLLLTGFDHDHGQVAARAFADRLGERGLSYPHLFSRRSNRGQSTGLDIDGDGRRGGARDAQGYGRFSGQSAMLLLSSVAIAEEGLIDLSGLLWAELPRNIMPPNLPEEQRRLQRLSTTGHYILPLRLQDGATLSLMFWHATPPVFDGPEDRNGRRNHDETALWLALLDGALAAGPPDPPFLLLGTANLDPLDGEGRPEALSRLLSHPMLQDSLPRAPAAPAEPDHKGDPRLDTAVFPQTGGLRLEVILASRDLSISGSGILRDAPETVLGKSLARASRHFPLWVDVAAVPEPAPK